MKTITMGALLVLGIMLSGCSMKYPMSAEEFRKMAPESMFGEVETFEINRSMSKIAKTFKSRANACLNKRLERQSCVRSGYGGTSCSTTIIDYNPTVRVSSRRVELHVQQEMEGNVITLGEVPKNGMYLLVADVTPISRNKSKLVIYGGSWGSDTLKKAIRGWASGRSKGCPDLTQG